ncbi:AraC family transcriptional regulator [Herbiconiux sp. CPCC 205763]|uniref:AraC family transcriptional regulator n=1 Tax=Herbiconiux aconitum TaxID=2970913 RepID=A0ABT2GMZ1_9MICO|nr:AraC family transcriptional regulator [Herbiconiux aconitum]MCS5717607.1 AraC family transcriptional regulator [Herbiconiux aconitum]
MAGTAELREQILRHSHGGVRHDVLPGVSIGVSTVPTEPASVMSYASMSLIAQGAKRTVLNGTAYDYRAGQFLVASLDLPVTGRVLEASAEQPFAVVTIALEPALLAALLLETPAPAAPIVTAMAVSDAEPALIDAVVRMLGLLDRPADIPVLAEAYRREILWRLLTSDQGGLVRQIGVADGSLARVSRSVGWIREHYAEPLRVEKLAGIARMSTSAFHRHFRSATSMTPIQFQKQIRLQEARTLLLTDGDDIAGVGFRVGYDSPSQFSREYRRAFGEPPARDAVRLRAIARPPVI